MHVQHATEISREAASSATFYAMTDSWRLLSVLRLQICFEAQPVVFRTRVAQAGAAKLGPEV